MNFSTPVWISFYDYPYLPQMTQDQKIELKERLKNQCAGIIGKRIESAILAMQEAQSAANGEEKSSAGDKYETGRAMSHLEKDMHARHLAENRAELAALLSVDCSRVYDTGSPGSLIECPGNSFFIAAGLGKQSFEGRDIFLLSPQAPLAKMLFNKKTGDTILFNQKEIIIKNVY